MYCRHCGKEIDDDNQFCPFCGKQLTVEQSADSKGDSLKKNNVLLWGVVALVVGAVIAVSAVFLTKNNKPVVENKNGEDQTMVSDQELNSDDIEQENVKGEDSYYKVGETYYILTNLRVREGPGKDYRILSRDELTAEDYSKSVDSEITNDALLKKGEMVTCQDMSGDWMRISSGWICVYDEGEKLVE